MFATVLNLPKWLLAALVFCIISGHCEQAGCRLLGCPSEVVHTGAKALAQGEPTTDVAADHCSCQCHFSVPAPFEVPPGFAPLRLAWAARLSERAQRAPEAPCAEIEYPPRSFRA